MKTIFPEAITNLPLADIPIKGLKAYISQGKGHQILYMAFEEDVDLLEHAHDAQYGVVLNGQIDLFIDGVETSFVKGDQYYIPAGVPHSGKIHAGYADITFFNEENRYGVIEASTEND